MAAVVAQTALSAYLAGIAADGVAAVDAEVSSAVSGDKQTDAAGAGGRNAGPARVSPANRGPRIRGARVAALAGDARLVLSNLPDAVADAVSGRVLETLDAKVAFDDCVEALDAVIVAFESSDALASASGSLAVRAEGLLDANPSREAFVRLGAFADTAARLG